MESNKEILIRIGEFLKEARIENNTSQEEVSNHIGISRKTLTNIQSGKNFNFILFIELLRYYDLIHMLDKFKYNFTLSPSEIFKLQKKKRKRAS